MKSQASDGPDSCSLLITSLCSPPAAGLLRDGKGSLGPALSTRGVWCQWSRQSICRKGKPTREGSWKSLGLMAQGVVLCLPQSLAPSWVPEFNHSCLESWLKGGSELLEDPGQLLRVCCVPGGRLRRGCWCSACLFLCCWSLQQEQSVALMAQRGCLVPGDVLIECGWRIEVWLLPRVVVLRSF